jgi:GAF domain-containing protein
MPSPAPFLPLARTSDLPVEIVRRALSEAREALGMEAACFTELTPTHVIVRAVDGDGDAFGLHEGRESLNEDSYCAAMIAGELPSWVPDTRDHPVAHALALAATDQSGVGAYAGVPVRHADGEVFGSLCCVSAAARPDLDARDARVCSARWPA